MPTRSLAEVRTFKQLLTYLEEELDWPIDEMDFDDFTFEYDAETDLGLDPKSAAKIKFIRQLRQIDRDQPFGIFFVEFEPKQLPVTVLRRILGKLVTSKRASANPTERKTWKQDDLIFVSAYGDDAQRRIDFAHFAEDATRGLPTLRVLGWDGDDTTLTQQWVEQTLREQLLWPDDETADEWRLRWRDAFALRHREVVDTSRKLATALASLAQRIRRRVNDGMAVESENGPLHKTFRAFRDALIHDLTEDGFADMYAQTITYGLLSAGVSRFVPGEGVALLADDAANLMPQTSPFLKELLNEFVRIGGRQRNGDGSGIDFDELGVNDVVDLLREANMDAVLRDFGRTRAGEDPVIYFYEDFMRDYSPGEKKKRGIFYTPTPVVSFIVRSVDEILREEFGLPLGLADTTTWGEMKQRMNSQSSSPSGRGVRGEGSSSKGEGRGEGSRPFEIPKGVKPTDPFVQILDPACGTGTFLVEVIDLIYKRMVEHWKSDGHTEMYDIPKLWNDYVADHLLPRLYGFELMMAPDAICHMKVGLKLAETGYRFRSSERLRVYLTNSLEPPHDLSEMLEFVAPFLAHEARAANVVKEHLRPTVVIGNPPYSTVSLNMGDWIKGLVDNFMELPTGRMVEKGNRNHLQDDYVKFMRLAQWYLMQTGQGILGFITNSSFISGSWYRGMRYNLLTSWPSMRVVDLHGGTGFITSHVGDENVFDIMQSVAVTLAARSASHESQVTYTELRGSRTSKYQSLRENTLPPVSTLDPRDSNQWILYPFDSSDDETWESGIPLTDAFVDWGAGVKTNRNGLAIGFDRAQLLDQIQNFADLSLTVQEVEEMYSFSSNYQWDTKRVRTRFAQRGINASSVEPYTFRAFDRRVIYWDSDIVFNMRGDKMEIYRSSSAPPALLFSRTTTKQEYTNVFASRLIADHDCLEKTKVAPVFRCRSSALHQVETWEPNLTPEALSVAMRDDHSEGIDVASDFFHLAYAQLHSPEYRRRFHGYLRLDVPRILRVHRDQCDSLLKEHGADLVALHLLEDDYPHASWNQPSATNQNPLAHPITTFHDAPGGDREVRKAGETGKKMSHLKNGKGRVYINDTTYFDGVPEAVWNFHIGGYQVCHKWLSDRKKKGGNNPRPGRVLTDEDIRHYHRIVIALNETIRLMTEIDEVINQHGGWPDAFVTDPDEIEKLRRGTKDEAP